MPDAPHLPPRGGILDLVRGAMFPVRAAVLILRVPRLRLLAFACAGITLLVFALWAAALWHWLPLWLQGVWARPEGVARWLWTLTVIVAGALAWLVGAATLPLLALAPLQDTLVDSTEAAVGAPPVPPAGLVHGAREAISALGRTAARVAVLVAGQVVLLTLQFLLPAAGPLWAVVGVGWTALWACAEYLDAPMARRGRSFREVRRVLAERTALSLGFGLAVTVLLWVPLLNLFLVPVAVTAGTLLHRSLVSAGTLP